MARIPTKFPAPRSRATRRLPGSKCISSRGRCWKPKTSRSAWSPPSSARRGCMLDAHRRGRPRRHRADGSAARRARGRGRNHVARRTHRPRGRRPHGGDRRPHGGQAGRGQHHPGRGALHARSALAVRRRPQGGDPALRARGARHRRAPQIRRWRSSRSTRSPPRRATRNCRIGSRKPSRRSAPARSSCPPAPATTA